ncbi:MAG: carbonic anhydrase [Cognaticolwellia sp.]|jgi:carbonic anhydrase
MSHFSELLQRNQRFAASAHAPLPMVATLNTLVVSCLDARADPAHFLGLEPGEALVIRNSGGRATQDVQQQIGMLLAMMRQMMGPDAKFDVVLVHHTQCGMERLGNPKVRAGLSAASGVPIESLECLAITDHDESLREDLELLRNSAWVPAGISVTGARYDQQNGTLNRVFSELT